MSAIETYLEGQTALVTGGSSGIGAACAVELARRGANVGVNYISHGDAAEDIAQHCRSLGVEAVTFKADVSDIKQVDRMFEQLLSEFGALDILIANAGIQKDAPFVEMRFEDWQKVLQVNLTGQYLCAQKAVQQFCRQGVRSDVSRAAGKILHISSVHDVIPWARHINYAASKGGVQMFMQSLAQEIAPAKIRVNAISPGAIKTDINKDAWSDPEKAKELETMIPYGRIGDPEDIARPAAWLLSDYADYITGETFYIDGGMTLYPAFRHGG